MLRDSQQASVCHGQMHAHDILISDVARHLVLVAEIDQGLANHWSAFCRLLALARLSIAPSGQDEKRDART